MHQNDIRHADFRRIDLNLLVAFDALMATQHVGQAAERLFIGQPAMSHALARLRVLLDDELFVRSGKRMAPTARALALGPRVRDWLSESAHFLLHEEPFEPALADGIVRVSIPDGLEALILPPLMAALRAEAPGVRVRALLLEVEQLQSALDEDEVDIVVIAATLPLRSWHQQVNLLHSGFNYLYSPAQLSLPQTATLADLAAQSHVVSSHRGEAASVVDHCFEASGLTRHVVVSATSMVAVSRILLQAPLVSVQPALYASLHPHDGIVVAPLPAEPPLLISVDMLWHRRNARHPLHVHVRGLISEIAARVRSQPA
jgi:LysR family transcriptional activator of mexEF-oprN operon